MPDPAVAPAEPIPFPPQPPHPGNRDGLPSDATSRPAISLRGQASATDARAERLVRQVRQDVERLQAALDQLGAERDAMLEVDAAAVAADPEAAATLPPAVLVRALIAADADTRRLRSRLGKARTREQKLRAHLHRLEIEGAAATTRLETLEEVLAALHANLADLRLDREFLHRAEGGPVAQRAGLPPPAGTP